jgi:hypothetical protein
LADEIATAPVGQDVGDEHDAGGVHNSRCSDRGGPQHRAGAAGLRQCRADRPARRDQPDLAGVSGQNRNRHRALDGAGDVRDHRDDPVLADVQAEDGARLRTEPVEAGRAALAAPGGWCLFLDDPQPGEAGQRVFDGRPGQAGIGGELGERPRAGAAQCPERGRHVRSIKR